MALLITKLPNFFLLVCAFITTCLLCFLLTGCYSTDKVYSGVYITRFEYNNTAQLDMTFNHTATSTANITENFSIAMGYLSFCIYANETECTTYKNIDKLEYYPVVAVQTEKADATLDLVKLATEFRQICFPWILMATIIVSILLLTLSIWLAIPFIGGKTRVRQATCAMSLVLVLVWGLGSMLQHEAASATKFLVPASSMNLIAAHTGKRAEAMTWTAFSFLAVLLFGNSFLLIREGKLAKAEKDPAPIKF